MHERLLLQFDYIRVLFVSFLPTAPAPRQSSTLNPNSQGRTLEIHNRSHPHLEDTLPEQNREVEMNIYILAKQFENVNLSSRF